MDQNLPQAIRFSRTAENYFVIYFASITTGPCKKILPLVLVKINLNRMFKSTLNQTRNNFIATTEARKKARTAICKLNYKCKAIKTCVKISPLREDELNWKENESNHAFIRPWLLCENQLITRGIGGFFRALKNEEKEGELSSILVFCMFVSFTYISDI